MSLDEGNARRESMTESLHGFVSQRLEVHRVVLEHIDELRRTRSKLLALDQSGPPDSAGWIEYVDHFRDFVVAPRFGGTLGPELHRKVPEIINLELANRADLERKMGG